MQLSRDFAKESGIRHFYDANQTILHTKFYRDLVQPGEVVLGADSHTSSHGGLGAFAIGLGGADIAVAMVLGECWIEVPEAIAVEYEGALPFGIGGKDVILKRSATSERNTVAMERSVEYRGGAAKAFSTDMRFTIANMTAEFGGLNGIFEADGIVADVAGAARSVAQRRARSTSAPTTTRPTSSASAIRPRPPRAAGRQAVLARQRRSTVERGRRARRSTARSSARARPPRRSWSSARWCSKPALQGRRERRRAAKKRIVVPGDLSHPGTTAPSAGCWRSTRRPASASDPPGCSMCLGVASEKRRQGETWLSLAEPQLPQPHGRGIASRGSPSGATVAAQRARR